MIDAREHTIELVNEAGRLVRADVRRPAGAGPFPTVVILPGFKGFKDWGMFPPTAHRLGEHGLASVSVNTSMNGVRGRDVFDDLEGFARNTPLRERIDVELVIAAIRNGDAGAELDGARLGLLGHSRGGGVALLVAARDPAVRAVVTWASIASFFRYTDRAIAQWRATGRLEVPNMRTGQMMWLDRSVLETLEDHRDALDLQRACAAIAAPCLFVHGERDEAVDAGDAGLLHAWCGAAEKEVVIVPGTGHTFGAVHPWAGPTPAWERALAATEEWFARGLA